MIPMNHVENKKKLNNKGFSLVELIIVIAIMAVLIGVLAPQYLRYVEKSRYQTDVTTIDNVKNAVQIAISTNEKVYTEVTAAAATADVTISWTSTGASIPGTELKNEVEQTIKLEDTKLTSKTLTTSGNEPSISIDKNGDVTVKIAEINSTPGAGGGAGGEG